MEFISTLRASLARTILPSLVVLVAARLPCMRLGALVGTETDSKSLPLVYVGRSPCFVKNTGVAVPDC